MQWQDLVFTVGGFVFTVALVPSLIGKDKPAITTSLWTGLVLVVFAGTYASLSLWLSAGSTLITASMWLVLAIQKWRLRRSQATAHRS